MKKQVKMIRRLVVKSIISSFIITILLLSHGDKTLIAAMQAIINQPYRINTLGTYMKMPTSRLGYFIVYGSAA